MTRKLDTKTLSSSDIQSLYDLIVSFRKEVQNFLFLLEQREWRRYCIDNRFRTLRKKLRAEGKSTSVSGLQGKHWKVALQQAAKIVEKYWKAVIRVSLTDVRRHGFYSSLNEAERFYVGCLLSNLTDMFFDMIEGKVPEPIVKTSHKTVVRDPKNLCAKIRHIVRGNIGKFPNANNWNCCVYDEDSYVVKEECGKQVIELMSKVPRQRICVPVVGNGPLSRTIKLYQRGEAFYLSVPSQSEVKELENIPKTVGDNKLWAESLDLGITEIFTSCENKRFGIGFGKMVNQYATMVSTKMFNRGKAIAAYEGSQGDKRERI